MDEYSEYRVPMGAHLGDGSYPNKLSGMRSVHSILPSKPYPSVPPRRGYQDSLSLTDPVGSVDSLLSGQPSLNGTLEDGSVGEIHMPPPTKLQPTPTPLEHFNIKARGLQLPVKHTNQIGTQVGILLPKYHIHAQSKCIMCRDCGIFFSHDSFLRHLHDNIGRRRECQSTMLELGIENPGVQQMRLWEEFLSKLRGESIKRPRTSSFDPGTATLGMPPSRNHSEGALNTHVAGQPSQSQHPVTHYSPRTSMYSVRRSPPRAHTPQSSYPSQSSPQRPPSTEASSIVELNRNIQDTVDASERLLRETSHYLASTQKSRHRRNRSVNLDLKPAPTPPVGSKPLASRSLFDSGPAAAQSHQPPASAQSDQLRPLALEPSDIASHPENDNGYSTDGISRDARTLAGGDPSTAGHNSGNSLRSQHRHFSDRPNGSRGLGNPPPVVKSEHPPQPDNTSQFPFPPSIIAPKTGYDLKKYQKEDPLFILQTAQELLALASHRVQAMKEEGSLGNGMQTPPSPGRDNEFLQLYHEERSKRRKYETQLQEMQDALKEEQRQRKELEIQLRALKLQR
ncbi:uncharacterized protein [Diadema setosum]|uniref:uncharacterized protein n=1 Tax=Diadema setosum TaxID=31175 RepID=UPI003B3A687B